jgi:catechol 2,3-dioxygenase-like lactoylglutathione lyase family enzyme
VECVERHLWPRRFERFGLTILRAPGSFADGQGKRFPEAFFEQSPIRRSDLQPESVAQEVFGPGVFVETPDEFPVHHFCFRARSREDVDAVHRFLVDELDAQIVHAPEEGPQFAPGYYSVLFEDPDGIRAEVNFVPGKGHLGDGGRLGPGGAGPRPAFPR